MDNYCVVMATGRTDIVPLRRPPAVDVAIAAVLLVMGWVLAVGNARIGEELFDDFEPPEMWSILLTVAVVVAPLTFRRVFPLGSLVLVTAGIVLSAIYGVVEITATTVAAFVALVSAGIYGREGARDWARGLFAVGLGAIFVAAFITRSGFDSSTMSPRLAVSVAMAEVMVSACYVALGWYLGDVERKRRVVESELEHRNVELQAALDKVDSQAANEERLSIAREVHDIVGHTVSLLGVQAAAARRQIAHQPEAAEAILKAMEDQSRGAVDEIRSLITVLRAPASDSRSDMTVPTPSFDHLDDLVEQVRSAGTNVAYSRQGPRPTNSGLGLSIYRVVQEALSNAIRHGDGNVELVVDSDPSEMRIFVANDLAREIVDSSRGDHDGSGLAGMEERVGLHGGSFSAGRNREGRFAVEAVLPMEPVIDLTDSSTPQSDQGLVAR